MSTSTLPNRIRAILQGYQSAELRGLRAAIERALWEHECDCVDGTEYFAEKTKRMRANAAKYPVVLRRREHEEGETEMDARKTRVIAMKVVVPDGVRICRVEGIRDDRTREVLQTWQIYAAPDDARVDADAAIVTFCMEWYTTGNSRPGGKLGQLIAARIALDALDPKPTPAARLRTIADEMGRDAPDPAVLREIADEIERGAKP